MDEAGDLVPEGQALQVLAAGLKYWSAAHSWQLDPFCCPMQAHDKEPTPTVCAFWGHGVHWRSGGSMGM